MRNYAIDEILAATEAMKRRHEVATVQAVLAGIAISPLMRTPAQWSAMGVSYSEPPIFARSKADPPAMRVAVEPDYFALAGALNLAAAYHPEVPDVR